MGMHTFSRQTRVQAKQLDLFDWHVREGAFERLSPPWERVRVRSRSGTILSGDTVDLEVKLGPIPLRWRARHQDYVPGEQFCDVQEGGPFKSWKHLHRFSEADDTALLDDDITYQLPLSPFSDVLAGGAIRSKLDRMFTYRHRTTRDDMAAHAQFDGQHLRVGLTGSSGLVGQTLAPFLTTGGHLVIPYRRSQGEQNGRIWDSESITDVDAVVHLAGESIDGRWTADKKERIAHSRAEGTAQLVESILQSSTRPRVLVCASAIGYYGHRADDLLDEKATKGDGFLSDVCAQWEAATQPARDAGIRVVNLRFGVVLSAKGGALTRMLPPFRLGAGGRIGSGEQYMSWIAIDDAIGAIHHALCDPDLSGPVNAVSPNPVTNLDFTKSLGRVLGRPTIVPFPAFAAKAAFGEMADALLLSSARCIPDRLIRAGYRFRYQDLEDALRFQLGRMPLSK